MLGICQMRSVERVKYSKNQKPFNHPVTEGHVSYRIPAMPGTAINNLPQKAGECLPSGFSLPSSSQRPGGLQSAGGAKLSIRMCWVIIAVVIEQGREECSFSKAM